MSEIVKELLDRAGSYRIGGPSSEHTAALLDAAADTITHLEGDVKQLKSGHQGACYACEPVGELNQKLTAENERLRAALEWWVTASTKENPFRSADFHSRECRCSRCAYDNAVALSQEPQG